MNRNTNLMIFAVVTLFAAKLANAATVLDGPVYDPANGYAYYLLNQDNWTNSQAEAVALGGNLATVTSAAENAWIFNTFSLAGGSGRALWIGYFRTTVGGPFNWVSGDNSTYTNWAPGQPDYPDEEYTYMLPSYNNYPVAGEWNNYYNSSTSTYGGIGANIPEFPINGVVEIKPHAVVSLASGTTAAAGYGSNIANGPSGDNTGTYSPSANNLTLSGGNGNYLVSQVTGINGGAGDAIDSVGATGWNPSTDTEIFGVDVLVNGAQANAAQISTLLTAIDGDGIVPASAVTASDSDPTGAFPGNYDLFLTFSGSELTGTSSDELGLDLNNANDPNLVGYTFSAVGVVPEPATGTLVLIAIAAISMRRGRR